jgi:hypothetical protein
MIRHHLFLVLLFVLYRCRCEVESVALRLEKLTLHTEQKKR